jgi:hypothetical protein
MFFHADSMRISLGAVKPRNRWLRIRPQIALHFLPLLFMKLPFHGFIQIAIGIGIAIGIDHLATGHFLGFQGFWFQGFIQIGIGIGIAIGIDHYKLWPGE